MRQTRATSVHSEGCVSVVDMFVCVQLLACIILLHFVKTEHVRERENDKIMPVKAIEEYMRKRKQKDKNKAKREKKTRKKRKHLHAHIVKSPVKTSLPTPVMGTGDTQLESYEPQYFVEEQLDEFPTVRVVEKPKKKKVSKQKKSNIIRRRKGEKKSVKVKKLQNNLKKHSGTKRKPKWLKKVDKDSNMSTSKEKSKPVDIIVHIKMNE